MNICRDGLEGSHKSFNPDMVPCEYDMLQKTYFKAVQSYFGNITEGKKDIYSTSKRNHNTWLVTAHCCCELMSCISAKKFFLVFPRIRGHGALGKWPKT